MILSENVDIFIIPKILKYYLNKGYNAKVGEKLSIKICDLSEKSMAKIKVKCDVCGNEKYLSYQKYNKNINCKNYYSCSQKCAVNKCKMTFLENYNETHPMKNKNMMQKSKNTCNEKYGVDFYFQTEEFKLKFTNTSLENYNETHPMRSEIVQNILKTSLLKKYGVENPMYLNLIKEKVRNTKIKNNIISPDILCSDLKIYKRLVKNITYKFRKELLKNWDGVDYYDNEYIEENFNLKCTNRLYPTVDHKNSVLYGFLNDIPPEEIGDISNLCITKKFINSIKKEKIEKLFKEYLIINPLIS